MNVSVDNKNWCPTGSAVHSGTQHGRREGPGRRHSDRLLLRPPTLTYLLGVGSYQLEAGKDRGRYVAEILHRYLASRETSMAVRREGGL
ncbi:hypothetical protein Pmani_039148 [Petrolisthes manimaculis]|uniref:Uncharacterized protein n=1 Tax=Petrolisthes manimaculis TaxID=1843537 RepID=A0AAE1NE88_9EUCA|nr:hypothetical protein Pmani_039148 [Petrolisthes manimaculis]